MENEAERVWGVRKAFTLMRWFDRYYRHDDLIYLSLLFTAGDIPGIGDEDLGGRLD